MKTKKLILSLSLLVVVLLGVGYFFFKRTKSKSFDTQILEVKKGKIERRILTTGSIQPYNRLEVKAPVAGRAEEVLVKEGDWVHKGQILAWMSSTERAVLLDAARSKGESTLRYWQSLYKATPLIAPLDGVIIVKNVQSGQTITQQDAVLVISDRLIVKAQVDETDISEIKTGEKVEVSLDAYPKHQLWGHTDHISYEAKTVNNVTVYEVDVLCDEIPSFTRSGMTANVNFLVQEKDQVLFLPIEAVEKNKSQHFVWLLEDEKNKKSEKREIQTGISDGKKIEIVSGLVEGQKVLIQNQNNSSEKNKIASSPFSPMGSPRR